MKNEISFRRVSLFTRQFFLILLAASTLPKNWLLLRRSHTLLSIVEIPIEHLHGRLLPIEPRDKTDSPKGAISNPNKGSLLGGEEEVARTPAIGTTKPRKEFDDTAQFVSQHTLLIRMALPIDDGHDFRISEEVVDMPVKPLYILEVTI
jgi:hypothetical protein